MNGVPATGHEEGGKWLHHCCRLGVVLKILHSIGTGRFSSKILETRTESKTVDTFVILEHQGVLGI